MCREPCIKDSGRWGANYCFTDYNDPRQWGAECVDCGMELVKKSILRDYPSYKTDALTFIITMNL